MSNPIKLLISFIVKPVNSFTLLILFGFALILIWIGQERLDDFIMANKSEADNATHTTSAGVEQVINDKIRLVEIFLEDNYEQISELALDPENKTLQEDLKRKLARYFSDFFSVNIASSEGLPIIDDFDGRLGDICIDDMQAYIKNKERGIRVHPNFYLYHFDIVISFEIEGEGKLFFVSFSLDDISRLLWLSQPDQHQLILIQSGEEDLIEVTETGGRDTITDRMDFRMTDDEKDRILSSAAVENTRWKIIDMHEAGLITGYRNTLLKEGVILYVIFSLCLLVIRSFLVREERRRARAEKKLVQRNLDFEKLNMALIKANTQLTKASMTDGLTGLNNRRHFDQRLAEELKRARRTKSPLSLMLIDVDYFKIYNDLYGHQAGDACLIMVSDVMRHVFKRADDFIARYGGEQFVVIMAGADRAHALEISRKFQETLEQAAIEHEGSQVHRFVTVSAGLVSLIPDEDDISEHIIKQADQALYTAKSEGRNRIKCI